MSSSAITTQVAQLKAGNIQNQADSSSIYSAGVWSFKNSTAVTSVAISDAGNVGIGTASPTYKLDVVGTANAVAFGTTLAYGVAGEVYSAFRFNNSSFAGGNSEIRNIVDGSGSVGSKLAFLTTQTGSGSLTERMRIDENGNVLVGATSSATALGFNVMSPAGDVVYTRTNHKTGAASGSYYAGFYYNGSVIGTISQNGTTGVAYNTGPSDYRLKEQVQDLSGGLDKIKALRPVSFVWKDNKKEEVGFIAHEIQPVIPECVTGEKDAVDAEGNPVYQSIFPAPTQMIANLVAAIQELSAKNEALEARLAALESKP